MRHLHLQHRRTPSFGRALAVALLVAAVAAHRPGEGSPFHPGNVEDDEDLLDDLEEPEPLEGDEIGRAHV